MKVYQSIVERFAQTRFGARLFVRIATALDRRLIRWSRGKLTSGVGTSHKNHICLLKVRGAKTGRLRTVPLLATSVGDSIVLVASNGGSPNHPAWYFNLKKNPACDVVLAGTESHRIAREVEGAERERYWAAASATYPGYESYAERAGREIPVMILERRPD